MGMGMTKELGPGGGTRLAAAPGPSVGLDRPVDRELFARGNVRVANPLDERHEQVTRSFANQGVAI